MLTKVGRYQIVDELGHGAMGVVYRGFDPTIGRTVAVKTVNLETGDPELLKRFRHEAQAAGILSHPNIVTIYDAGEDEGVFYIAMEYVEGETLQQVIARGPLPAERATSIVEQVGVALDHAHARHIIHRDIKPANIMIAEGVVKVMDFGVAKISSMGLTTTGQVLGTPTYMSPEIVKGVPVDGRADIFSLGIVLYEMLAGAKPFTGDNVTTVIYKIIGEQPEPLDAVLPKFGPELNYVVMKALAKDPAERYQTGAELVADLKNLRGLDNKMKAAAARAQQPKPPEPARVGRERTGTVVVDRAAIEAAHQRLQEAAARPQPAPAAPARRVAQRPEWLAKAGFIGAGAVALLGGVLLFMKFGPPSHAPAAPPAATTPAETRPPARSAGPSAPRHPAGAKPAGPSAVTLDFQVTANVEGATIRVDGKTQSGWITPHWFTLPLGLRRIEVSKPGYVAHTKAVGFTADGPRLVKFELAPVPASPAAGRVESRPERGAAQPPPRATAPAASGRLVVHTRPPGASISVDGEMTPYHSPVNFVVPAGRHKVTVQHEGFESVTEDVVIPADGMTPLEVRLHPSGEGRRRRFPFPR